MFTDEQLIEVQPRLIKFARKLTNNAGMADDLVNDTNLRMLENKDKFKDDGRFPGWAMKIMYNIFCAQFRRRAKFESMYDPDEFLIKLTVPANQNTEAFRLFKLLAEPDRQILGYALLGFTMEEIAEFQKVPIGTVKSRLSRARDKFRVCLNTGEAPQDMRIGQWWKQNRNGN